MKAVGRFKFEQMTHINCLKPDISVLQPVDQLVRCFQKDFLQMVAPAFTTLPITIEGVKLRRE